MLKYNIDTAFKATPESILEFFQRPGIGFYIPNYQRPYSWDEENVGQMMTDLCSGVEMLRNNDDAVTFFGTLIMLSAGKNKDQVAPKDPKAVPSEVLITIDGQQRLSTMALLAVQLHHRILSLAATLPKEPPYAELCEEAHHVGSDLLNLFALDMKSGSPSLKPKIIRAQDDTWTFDGPDEIYKSEVANYLASYIRTLAHPTLPKPPKKTRIAANVDAMGDALTNVAKAHVAGTPLEGKYPVGDVLMTTPEFQSHIWKYERPELAAIVQQRADKVNTPQFCVSSLAQLFLFANYLLQRCCLTVTRPNSEDWAFDMFQSLNATGTPLTALETFLPLVIREEEKETPDYKKSVSAQHMQRVEELLKDVKDNASKNSLTNSLLTSFALAYNGEKLSNKFSAQRKWLNKEYVGNNTLTEKRKFTEYLGDVAEFTDECWLMPSGPAIIAGLETHVERKLASFLMRFMKDANFQIIASVLSRFYEGISKGRPNAGEEFVEAVKATAAFFTLWRSARSNSGLDDVFRQLMLSGYEDGAYPALSWATHPAAPLASELKRYYRYKLNADNLGDHDKWIAKAEVSANYRSAKIVCRFLLFVAAHDTDVDQLNPGLMRIATAGVHDMFDPELWVGKDLKEIEHVAPVTPAQGANWDETLYPDESFNTIGNLTLLSKEINASASNQGWPTKLLYYQHLGITIPEEIDHLRELALAQGAQLTQTTIDTLRNTHHQHHMKPIIQRSAEAPWDRAFVQQRTLRILDIGWQRMYAWLSDDQTA